jgi:hypothetical protein
MHRKNLQMTIRIKLENAAVSLLNATGTGYKVEVKVPGQDWGRSFTVWASDRPPLGASVNVTGELSWKMREYTNQQGEVKQTVDMNINNPTYEIITPVTPEPMIQTDQVPF